MRSRPVSLLSMRKTITRPRIAARGSGAYAQRFVSTPGNKDGLYWPTAQGEERARLARCSQQRRRRATTRARAARPITVTTTKIPTKRQGPAATGGAVDYVVNGKMIGGYGLVAYPDEYRNSGVMTFIVNHDGTVFQKDLGPKTGEIAEAITAFNPDKGWTRVEPAQAAK